MNAQAMKRERKFSLTSGDDRVRLRELKKIDVYEDVVRYMLHNNVKLEQEIVSLTLMRNETNS